MTGNGSPDGDDEPTDDDEATVRRRSEGESIAGAVAEAVAAATGADPVDLAPLHGVVDPDALEQLFSPVRDPAGARRQGHVRFRFEGCVVTVHADGRIVARPAPDGG